MLIKMTKIKLEKQDAARRKAFSAGQASSTRTGAPPEEDVQNVPAGSAGTHEGWTTSLNHSATTHVIN